jgi:hypothetical protein
MIRSKFALHTVLTTLVLSSAVLSPVAFAGEPLPLDSKIGTIVTITGCLHPGRHANQFVLVDVTALAAPGQVGPVADAIYWLDSTHGMKALVGQLVDVTGQVVKRDSKQGVIKLDFHPNEEKDTNVTIETASRAVTTRAFAAGPDGKASSELRRPVYQVHVEDISAVAGQPVGASCK